MTFDYLTEYTYLISGNFFFSLLKFIQLKRIVWPLAVLINMVMCFIFDCSKARVGIIKTLPSKTCFASLLCPF